MLGLEQSIVRFLALIARFAAVAVMLAGFAGAQVYTIQQSFTTDAATPGGYPIQGRDGKIYGSFGGDPDTGCGGGIFRAPEGAGAMTLFSFTGSFACDSPSGGLTLGTDGYYYGATYLGGTYNDGTLFKTTPGGPIIVLYNFANQGDGAGPIYAPVESSDGYLYGTTGGVLNNNFEISGSSVYKYNLSTGDFTSLYQFGTGGYTAAPLIQGWDGNLYVTVPLGGDGQILKISTAGLVLSTYQFTGGSDGAYPWAPLMQASDGNFYGTTQQSCTSCGYYGTIFRMTPQGVVTTIHSFEENHNGNLPQSGLTEGTDGYLYGATWGNYSGYRLLYRVSKGGYYSVLYNSVDDPPYDTQLIQHTNGIFYGTAIYGGTDNAGILFSLQMDLGPFVKFVQSAGVAGGTAEILGQGLTGATSVTFNGVVASSFRVVSDTYMTAVVPSGATTGKVVVTTPGGAFTSNVSFRISK